MKMYLGEYNEFELDLDESNFESNDEDPMKEYWENYYKIYLPKPPAVIYVEGISNNYEPIPFADIEVKGEWLN